MAENTQITSQLLRVEGRTVNIAISKPDPTTVRLTWNMPSPLVATNGVVVLLSEERFGSTEFPEDGTRYTASADWILPADVVGRSNVVAAFYGFFGDSLTQTTVDVFNVDPTKIYHASIHVASNILQYYAQGKQSYPIDAAPFDASSAVYSGQIPRTTIAPSDPTNGQVYFDPSNNTVYVWNDANAAWVIASDKTVPVGTIPPVTPSCAFFNFFDDNLKYFDGTDWVICDATNTRVKMGSGWAPFAGATEQGSFPKPADATVGEVVFVVGKSMMAGPPIPETKVYTLGGWFKITADLIQVDLAGVWSGIILSSVCYGQVDPAIPLVGDFFYDVTNRDLLVWNGGAWIKADTEQEGDASNERLGVGTDGSQYQRTELIDTLKRQLGYPQACVELTEQQFDIAVSNAIETFRMRADNAYAHKHLSITMKRGQTVYYLNDPRNGTDKIVNVIKVHRVNMLGLNNISSEAGLYAQSFFNRLFQGSMVDMTSIHLFHQLSEQFEKIFAGNLVYTWDESSRQLNIMRRLAHEEERVVLEVYAERTEQELLQDRWCKQWLQAWAESEMLEMLGLIRTKYGSLPGPNGGLTLNGDVLLNMASEKQAELQRQINDFEVGNGGVNFGNTSLLIG